MILHGFVEVALALPLIGAIAVDDREIIPVISAGIESTRTGLDCVVARPSYANLAVVGLCRNNKPNGRDTDKAGPSPFYDAFCAQHQTPPRCLVKVRLNVAFGLFSSHSCFVAPGKEAPRPATFLC